MKSQSRRFALITGAGGGLGSAFAMEAARKGWNLVLIDLPSSGVKELGQRLERAYTVETYSVAFDLADADGRERLVAWIAREGIEVDLLINNAGTGSCSAFESAPLSRLAGIIDVNVQALMQLTYLFLPQLKRRRRATILNVASLAAFYPMPSMAVYAATKSFILNFSLAIRHELAGTGVSVSALCPAGMVTNRDTADQVDAQGFFGKITTLYPERVAAIALRQALRGRDVIIPGVVNRLIRCLSAIVPRAWVIRIIGGRWRTEARTRPAPTPRAAERPPLGLPSARRARASIAEAPSV